MKQQINSQVPLLAPGPCRPPHWYQSQDYLSEWTRCLESPAPSPPPGSLFAPAAENLWSDVSNLEIAGQEPVHCRVSSSEAMSRPLTLICTPSPRQGVTVIGWSTENIYIYSIPQMPVVRFRLFQSCQSTMTEIWVIRTLFAFDWRISVVFLVPCGPRANLWSPSYSWRIFARI